MMPRPSDFYPGLVQPGAIAERLATEKLFSFAADGTNLEADILEAVSFYGLQPGLSAIKSSFDIIETEPYNTCLAVGISIGLLAVAESGDRLNKGVRAELQADSEGRFSKHSKTFKKISRIASQQSMEMVRLDEEIGPILHAMEHRSSENQEPNPHVYMSSGFVRSTNVIDVLRAEVLQTL